MSTRTCALTSSRVSNLQLLPSSVTSFHHLSPTKSLPATFFVCSKPRVKTEASFLRVVLHVPI